MDDITAKELASILAMKSVEMLFPPTKDVEPDLILEARYKLSDQLPPFWSAMFKLTKDLKTLIKDCNSESELIKEGVFLVDTVVRPALIDLSTKMEKERKDWFYKILAPIQKCLRVLVGNPPVTQQQLITSALVLSSDVAMSAAENMRTIEKLKSEAGLTYLLDLSKLINKNG